MKHQGTALAVPQAQQNEAGLEPLRDVFGCLDGTHATNSREQGTGKAAGPGLASCEKAQD